MSLSPTGPLLTSQVVNIPGLKPWKPLIQNMDYQSKSNLISVPHRIWYILIEGLLISDSNEEKQGKPVLK
jgi:hypothetical protein